MGGGRPRDGGSSSLFHPPPSPSAGAFRLRELGPHLLPALVEQHGAPAQLELPSLVRLQQLHVDPLSLLDDVARVGDARDVQFADVAETLDPREDLDERAEIENLGHPRVPVRLANLGFNREILDDLNRACHVAAETPGQGDDAIVLDVDGVDLGLLDDGLDLLAALPDHLADVLGGNLDDLNLRRVHAHLPRGWRVRLVHLAEDVNQARTRGLERLAQHGEGDTLNLDVHLESRDAVAVARDFEVHIPESVLAAEDVGEDHGRLPLGLVAEDETHGDTRDFPANEFWNEEK